MESYQELYEKHTAAFHRLNNQYNRVSVLRLTNVVLFFFCFYFYLTATVTVLLFVLIFLFLTFLFLMKYHIMLAGKRELEKTLAGINQNEISFLKGDPMAYADGSEFIDPSHAYSYDLDLFGPNSFFQNINRTGSYIGNKKLAGLLLTFLPKDTILANQSAIKDLAPRVEFRQKVLALAKIGKDNKSYFDNISKWAATENKSIPGILIAFSYITPVLWLLMAILYAVTKNPDYSRIASAVFLINLLVVSGQYKKIKQELINSDKVQKVINQYSLIIGEIEKQNFENEKLKKFQAILKVNNLAVSDQIKKLSGLFSQIESIKNIVGASILNGIFLYHIHTLVDMYKWRKKFTSYVPAWLDLIGEAEALNSLANFSYNNPAFVFPEINTSGNIVFSNLGHPLIHENKRICNTISFTNEKFIVLTGSNMAGKSTFLRTLGINMILTGIGSVICASSGNVHPLPVWVSMRLSDSLHDNESYFFKEVKRLKEIMEKAEQETCFVILDEILRGTNSDDKRNGTIGVIKKIVEKKAIGAIATHDLEICNTTLEYPGQLVNKCFEVEIINDDLSFDYKLRDGICKNKSATFLMKKLQVI